MHVGAHLYHGARTANCAVALLNSEDAFQGNRLIRKLNWWVRGRRPTRLKEFSEKVLQACRELQPECMLSTGIAPISDDALKAVGALGIPRLNYLTDDPWNPHHKAPWFLRAIPQYDQVFSPRRANLEDLRQLRGPNVSYLPFAYDPETHFPEPPVCDEEWKRFASDVVFAGGADRDRLPYIAALVQEGFRVALYGGYWHRHSATRRHALGHADPATLRKAIGGAKVALCLVRRANRDGHSMRTFEIAATGACMLIEDTADHREMFGCEGEAVAYFRTISDMVQRLRWLIEQPVERRRLAEAARLRIVNGRNTYTDRVSAMLTIMASLSEKFVSF